MEHLHDRKLTEYRKLLWLVFAMAAAFVIAKLPIEGLAYEGRVTLAAFAFMVILWIFEVLPVGLAALIWGVSLMVILGDAKLPARIIFSGFTNSVIWLMLGAFLLGEATVKTGLARRLAFQTMKYGGSSYVRVLLSLWIALTMLGLLTPSGTVRAAMMIPIMAGIVKAYKAEKNSNFSANLLLHVYWATILGSTLWYTGTNINVTAMGVLKSVTGFGPSWIAWFIWQIIPSLFFFIGCFLLIQWIMPPEKNLLKNAGDVIMIRQKLKEIGPMSSEEKKTLGFFSAALILWATESFHHVDTAWVSILIGALLFLPGIGVLKSSSLKSISWDTILLLGMAMSITNVMKVVGLDTWVIRELLGPILIPLSPLGDMGTALGVTLFVALVHIVMASAAATTALLAPLLVQYASINGLNAPLVAMVTAQAAKNVFVLPYQTTMLVILWGTGYMDMKKCIKGFGVLCIFQILWIVLLSPYWCWIMSYVR